MKSREKPSLAGVRDKLRRAKAHREKLQEIIAPIERLHPYIFTGEVRGHGRNTTDLRHAGSHEVVTWGFAGLPTVAWGDLPVRRAPATGLGVDSEPATGALVRSYLPSVVDASRAADSPVSWTPAGMVAVRAAGLQVHGGGTVTARDAAPAAGELAVFCRPVVTAPVAGRRDGRVLADGWLPDFVRLGELERHLGDGVIEEIVAAALEQGRLKKRRRRRLMSYPLVIRLMLAMTLMPDGSYCEALARLAGLLADVPFTLEWHVPTGKVVTDWRALVPASLMEEVFWRAAGPLIADDDPQAVLLAGMMVCAADGMLVNVADTPANRKAFGCTGTAAQDGEGAAPFPQLRIIALAARAGRAMPGAICGRARAGEQTLLRHEVARDE